QAKTCPFTSRFGGEERFEDFFNDITTHSRAVIRDLDTRFLFIYAACRNRNAPMISVDCIAGVTDQVEHHLFKLPQINTYARSVISERELDRDIVTHHTL